MNLGQKAETAAEAWLVRVKKYIPHKRNVRCPGGEVDLVMRDGADWVFIEVKARTSDRFGSGAESITKRKIIRMLRVVEWFFGQMDADEMPPFRLEAVVIENGKLEHLTDLS